MMGGWFHFYARELRVIGVLSLLLALGARAAATEIYIEVPKQTKRVKVRVVVILASKEEGKTDPHIACIARHVRKEYPELKSFTEVRDKSKSIPINSSGTFKLCQEAEAVVKVLQRDDDKDCATIKLKVPTVGTITYRSKCGKFFPIVSGHWTKDGQRLIIAVCLQPCNKK